MKLIVGLGNPGKEYKNTRHNIGFDFLDYFVSKNNYSISWTEKFDGLVGVININNEKVLLFKPLTFMNSSGIAVSKISNFYKISSSDILVISDDMDLNVGNFKLKVGGSSGGHNGLKSINELLGTCDYLHLKVGISKASNGDVVNYVLGRFSKSDRELIDNCFDTLILVMRDYFKMDFGKLMCEYNRKNR